VKQEKCLEATTIRPHDLERSLYFEKSLYFSRMRNHLGAGHRTAEVALAGRLIAERCPALMERIQLIGKRHRSKRAGLRKAGWAGPCHYEEMYLHQVRSISYRAN
jgi:hypothetical protein